MKTRTYDIEAVFLGEVVDVIGKILKEFRSADGQKFHFTGPMRGVYFGESYLISKDGFIERRPFQPEKQTVFPTKNETLEFEVNKEIVKLQRLKNKKAMDLKKPHADIARAIYLLRPFCRKLDYLTLSRFCDYLKNELSRKSEK